MEDLPARPRPPESQDEWEETLDRLLVIGSVIAEPEAPDDADQRRLWSFSRSRTNNLVSREARFPIYLQAFSHK
jgi:hypothetical protein